MLAAWMTWLEGGGGVLGELGEGLFYVNTAAKRDITILIKIFKINV
jgi:hypothetical protein